MACGVTFFGNAVELLDAGVNVREITSGNACARRFAFVIHQEIVQVTVIIKTESLCCPDHRCRLPRALLAQETVRPAHDRDFRHLFIGKITSCRP